MVASLAQWHRVVINRRVPRVKPMRFWNRPLVADMAHVVVALKHSNAFHCFVVFASVAPAPFAVIFCVSVPSVSHALTAFKTQELLALHALLGKRLATFTTFSHPLVMRCTVTAAKYRGLCSVIFKRSIAMLALTILIHRFPQ
jgi:hypothetical protein